MDSVCGRGSNRRKKKGFAYGCCQKNVIPESPVVRTGMSKNHRKAVHASNPGPRAMLYPRAPKPAQPGRNISSCNLTRASDLLSKYTLCEPASTREMNACSSMRMRFSNLLRHRGVVPVKTNHAYVVVRQVHVKVFAADRTCVPKAKPCA